MNISDSDTENELNDVINRYVKQDLIQHVKQDITNPTDKEFNVVVENGVVYVEML